MASDDTRENSQEESSQESKVEDEETLIERMFNLPGERWKDSRRN